MLVLDCENVNDALKRGIELLLQNHTIETSRYGPVWVAPMPVTTVYRSPLQRVLLNQTRHANPFFHLMEAIWHMAGHNDLAWVRQFNERMATFSDNGHNLWGAYGYRWRNQFEYDQLLYVAKELQQQANSRRAVLSMWDPNIDLEKAIDHGKDIPCNTHIYFQLGSSGLGMTVCNRSNDILWGAYGINIVTFTVLQEWLAAFLEVPVGGYWQVSNNYHLYPDIFHRENLHAILYDNTPAYPPQHYPLVAYSAETWLMEAERFLGNPGEITGYSEPWWPDVAVPMYRTWQARRQSDEAAAWAESIMAKDWRLAAQQWLAQAKARKEAARGKEN